MQRSFSVDSRRLNNLFSMAIHEVQSSTAERELYLGHEMKPSNIRIHGTMYRKVLDAAEDTPVRYLIIDPEERHVTAKKFALDLKIVKRLETIILPRNPYMREIKRLADFSKTIFLHVFLFERTFLLKNNGF